MHIGNLIRQKVKEENKTSVWLAEQLSCSRTNVYKLYDKKSIDTDILFRISSILKFDFFSIYSEEVLQKGLSLIGLHANQSGTSFPPKNE